jgi:hypothetical protein
MSADLFDLFEAQVRLLWCLPAARRAAVIEDTKLDYEYFWQLQQVEEEMGYEL